MQSHHKIEVLTAKTFCIVFTICVKEFFQKKRAFSTKPQIDLYYNDEDLSDHVILTIKFCSDIKTIEIDGYYFLVKEAMNTIYDDEN